MPAPSSSPGHHLPRRGLTRADILARLSLLGIMTTLTPVAVWSLWWAGQLAGLFTHAAWPDSTPGDAPGIAVHLARRLADPAHPWPASARAQVGPGWLLYPLWLLTFAAALTGIAAPVLSVARSRVRRRGFAGHRDLHRVLTADAVRARVDVVRPGLSVLDGDDDATRTAKLHRAGDPLETGRFLCNDILTK